MFRKIPRTKNELKNFEERKYMKELIEKVEKQILKKIKQETEPKSKIKDLSKTIPKKLYNRVSKIIKLESIEDESFEDEEEIDMEEIFIKNPKMFKSFNESTLSEIKEKQDEYNDIDLKIESKPVPCDFQESSQNWMTEYLHKKPKDRIQWQSKLYSFDKKLNEKPMFEQAEELIDLAAQDFTDWINRLATDSESNITKELIKELFPIGLEGDASKAMYIEPKEIKALPNEIATDWGLNELSLQDNVVRLMKLDKIEDKLPKKYVAFGRTLPVNLRRPQPGADINPLKPVFPEELKSMEVLFKGITHLRSTKLLAQHFKDNPDLRKPKYLIDEGVFNETEVLEESQHIPLYEHFLK